MKMISKLVGIGLATAVFLTSAAAQVTSWGDNSLHQRDLPTGFVSAAQISAGYGFAVACLADGTVKAWGTNAQGKTTVPAGLNHVVQVGAGKQFAVALKDDGTVVAWGGNDFGQRNIPAGLSGVKQISAGDRHTLALKDDGTVVAWGGNPYHQTDVPPGLTGVTQVAAGGFFSMALKADGTVVCWGDNTYFECNVPVGLTDVVQIAGGRYFAMALKRNGNVVCWGSNDKGQGTVPTSVVNITRIAAGDNFALAQNTAGALRSWGDNSLGQTAFPASLGYVSQLVAGVGFAMVVSQPHITYLDTEVYPGGNTGSLTVTMGRTAGTDTQVFLGSDPSFLLPSSVTVRGTSSSTSVAPKGEYLAEDRYIYLTASFSGGLPYTFRLIGRAIVMKLTVGRGGIEGDGGTANGNLTLNHSVSSKAYATLTSDHPELFAEPAYLSFYKGDHNYSKWTLKTIGNVTVKTPVTFTATLGPIKQTASTYVVPPVDLSRIDAPSPVKEGNSFSAYVVLTSKAPADGVKVEGTISGSGASYPLTFPVKGGATRGSVTGSLQLSPSEDTDYVLTATHNGKSVQKIVHVFVVPLKALTLSASSVTGGSNTIITGTVELGDSLSNAYVGLTSSDPIYAKVPTSVTISGTKATFTLTHYKVTSPKVVTITATRNGISKSTTITVNP